jgi:hypothetical protein
MKIIYSFFTVLLLLNSNTSCSQNENTPEAEPVQVSNSTNLDSLIQTKEFSNEKVLKTLFSGSYMPDISKIKWTPYPGEKVHRSFNGLCYTNVDSIFYTKNLNSDFAIVVLRTISVQDEESEMQSYSDDVTLGFAVFEKIESNWKLINSNRSVFQVGQDGVVPNIEILKLNPIDFGLLVTEYEHNADCYTYLFSLSSNNFSKELYNFPYLKVINISSDDGTAIIEYSSIVINKDFKEIEPRMWTYPTIELTTNKTELNGDHEKILQKRKKTLNYLLNRYE